MGADVSRPEMHYRTFLFLSDTRALNIMQLKLSFTKQLTHVYVEPKALVYASHAWTSIWLVCAAPVACLPLHHFTGQV
ncbi:hypothetical protein JG687_00012959 [Phytophthora cactorum]|uniref:Uncharacterized protein n=1 Tax=Phytophthora cactorum TaxID=29920 RepID=A0A8T1U0L9_9STRA|nr:hypothetical protein JG687_00012959 [Phytophthora cactorum]